MTFYPRSPRRASLRHVIFHGGTALRLCYGGERYSEDLDFVCGKAGSYLGGIDFDGLVDTALEVTRRTLQRDVDIDAVQIVLKRPAQPELIEESDVNVAAWQIVVPVGPTPNTAKSRIKVEFTNVPSYDSTPVALAPRQGWCRYRTSSSTQKRPAKSLRTRRSH